LLSYGHETLRDIQTTGKEEASSHCLAEGGTQLSFHCRKTEIFFEFGGTLVPSLSEEGDRRASTQANAWTSTRVIAIAEEETAANPGERTSVRRLLHRSVDAKEDGQGNRKAFRGTLSPRSCMVVDDGTGVELPEAGTQSAGERRSGHCSLEEDHLAAYKKKPKNLKPIWPFSMNPDFCSSPTSERPGRPWEKLPFSGTIISGIGSPSSLALLFPRIVNVWDCTSISIRSILPVWRLSISFATSFVTLKEMWCFSGMAEQSIGARLCEISCNSKQGFTSFVSRLMLRRSIPRSLSGPKPSVLCPTARPMICENSEHSYAAPSKGLRAPSGCCGPACKPPICHGRGNSYPFIIRKSIRSRVRWW